MGVTYAQLGQLDESLEQIREAHRLEESSGLIYGNLVWAYLVLNRLEEARATAKEAEAKNLDSVYRRCHLYRSRLLAE